MRIYEIFPKWNEMMGEYADQISVMADKNIDAAKRQKKQAQIQKTKSSLLKQTKALADIAKPKIESTP